MAEEQLFGLTRQQVELIKRIINSEIQRPQSLRGRSAQIPDNLILPSSPDVLIVKATAGVGTGGIGALTPPDDTPDHNTCEVYRILDDAGTPTLTRIEGFNLDVYNVAPNGVPDDGWALVSRDKWGNWVFTSSFASVSSITVAEVDGSPSAIATELRFDQTDGFVVTNVSGSIYRVDLQPATASQAGGVSTSVQTFGGEKTFSLRSIFSNGLNLVKFATLNRSAVSISGTQIDYSLSGNESPIVYVTPTSSATIKSIINLLGLAGDVGVEFFILNADTGSETLTLKHQSNGATTASYRIICENNVDIVLYPGDWARLWYDYTAFRWRACRIGAEMNNADVLNYAAVCG